MAKKNMNAIKPLTKKKTKKVTKKTSVKATIKKASPKDATKKIAKKKLAKKTTAKKMIEPLDTTENPIIEIKMKEILPEKEKKRKRRSKADLAAEENLTKLIKKWENLHKKSAAKGLKPMPYSMKKKFDAQTPIQHKLLGWGYIMNNINDRLEVLFKDGVKYLISNYK